MDKYAEEIVEEVRSLVTQMYTPNQDGEVELGSQNESVAMATPEMLNKAYFAVISSLMIFFFCFRTPDSYFM